MDNIGPDLEDLTRRLLETPAEFLAEPRMGSSGAVHVAALVFDLVGAHAISASPVVLMRFQGADGRAGGRVDRNRLALAAIAVWLLAADWFASIEIAEQDILEVLDGAVTELACASAAHKFVSDPDRREELARVVLARLHYRPAGETLAQAMDRLSSISGTERQRLLRASRAAEQRARQIREALARKAAQESADKWSRE